MSLKYKILIEGLWLGSTCGSERGGAAGARRKFCVKQLRDLCPVTDTNCEGTDCVMFCNPLFPDGVFTHQLLGPDPVFRSYQSSNYRSCESHRFITAVRISHLMCLRSSCPAHCIPFCFLNICLNIILPSRPVSSNWSVFVKLALKSLHTCHILHPSHSP